MFIEVAADGMQLITLTVIIIDIVIILCLSCHLQKDRWPITMSTFELVTDNVIML